MLVTLKGLRVNWLIVLSFEGKSRSLGKRHYNQSGYEIDDDKIPLL